MNGAVTSMYMMFREAYLFNCGEVEPGSSPVSTPTLEWDTSSVTSMEAMFESAKRFNCNITAWKTGAVTSMGYMFYGAKAFCCDISEWDIKSVTSMTGMFIDSKLFDNPPFRTRIISQKDDVQVASESERMVAFNNNYEEFDQLLKSNEFEPGKDSEKTLNDAKEKLNISIFKNLKSDQIDGALKRKKKNVKARLQVVKKNSNEKK